VSLPQLDCQACGACCCNTADNRAEGFRYYVEVEESDSLRVEPALLQKWTVNDEQGVPHLKLEPNGRCQALRGKLGKKVWCEIYALRPSGCRRVVAGSQECLDARRDKGMRG
jgi:Fe-S-cluster containining protein